MATNKIVNCFQCGRKVEETTVKELFGRNRTVCADRDDCHDNTDPEDLFGYSNDVEDTPSLEEPWWRHP